MPDHHLHIYLGTDDLAIRKQVAKFSSKFTDPTSASMNTSRLDVLFVSENEIANIANAMPFLAEERLLVLENVGKHFKDKEKGKTQEYRKIFLTFLETVPAFTRIVILEPGEIKEKEIPGHWLVKWVMKNPEIAEYKAFMLPAQREMPAWIVKEAKNQGGAIELPAAVHLAEMTGVDTRQAAQEITKLLTYVNYAHTIGKEDVDAVSIVTASVDVFDLVDALGTQNGKQAQKLFHRLLEDKDAFEVFGMVIRQFRLLTLARDIIDDGGRLPDVVDELGLHPYVAEKCFNQARNFTMDTLKGIYHRILAMDEASKTGAMSLEVSLDILIVELSGQ
ncbi:MAG: DNA polymerase III subunit delta [Chloroflexi bacterium]|nr:DNA polymerase III subunit delta [Chloroflexota bacterium]